MYSNKKKVKEKELDENSTCANFAQVADNGKTYLQYGAMARVDMKRKIIKCEVM